MKLTTKNFSFLLIILLSFAIFSYKIVSPLEKHNFLVHFIDVGQGDSILIQANNKNLLIDSGTEDSIDHLVKYLKKSKVKKLDYIIATHPHADHIGGMNVIIDKFNVGSFFAPKVSHTNESFKSMITSLKNKNLPINILNSKKDISIDLGKNTNIKILAPTDKDYENINNYSPIIKIYYGKTSFLFTGDAEEELENEVLSENFILKANVLKIGHHGSNTSTSEEFLKEIQPQVAIISAGLDNSYGHPNYITLQKLNDNNVRVLRTDEDGTIVISSNGNNINVLNH
ncbi:ComEC/Rec2 family competence protein [Clostridium sp. B9]|uniref:ComEC/Rec2 family competence protein n=1 Tax=Clostridium sp. B9 TaxID=3423224 RepID=UPI003D2EA5C1